MKPPQPQDGYNAPMRRIRLGALCLLLAGLLIGACTRKTVQDATLLPYAGEVDLPAADRPRSLSDAEGMPTAIGMVSAVNVLRVQAGLPPLAASGTLMVLGKVRAEAMAEGRYLGHEDPAGASPSARQIIEDTGFRGAVAELVYANQGPLETLATDAVRAWERTPANREVLLSPEYAFAGVGLEGDGSWWKVSLLLAASEP